MAQVIKAQGHFRRKRAINLVMKERLRQIKEEGHTLENDEALNKRQLAQGAVCFLTSDSIGAKLFWPWGPENFKPAGSYRESLVKGLAMGLAELERVMKEIGE